MVPSPEQDGWCDPDAQYRRKPGHTVVGGSAAETLASAGFRP